jgi:hypothetical protein
VRERRGKEGEEKERLWVEGGGRAEKEGKGGGRQKG